MVKSEKKKSENFDIANGMQIDSGHIYTKKKKEWVKIFAD